MWSDDLILWKTSYENEKTFMNATFYALQVNPTNKKLARELILGLIDDYNLYSKHFSFAVGKVVVFDRSLTTDGKLKFYDTWIKANTERDDPWASYFIGQIFFQKGLYPEGFDMIRKDFHKEHYYYPYTYWYNMMIKRACINYYDKQICDEVKRRDALSK